MSYEIKDSGERREFASGMVRDTAEGKIDWLSCRFGPMFRRWNKLMTAGRKKYPDPKPGVPNWTLAGGEDEFLRARQSAARHFEQWLAGDTDEDHAAAVYFNINVAEYVREKLDEDNTYQKWWDNSGACKGAFNTEVIYPHLLEVWESQRPETV